MTNVEFFKFFDEIQEFDDLELLTEDEKWWLIELEESDWY